MAPGSVNLVLILDGNCRSSCRTVGQDLLESVDQMVLTPLVFFLNGLSWWLLTNNTVHRQSLSFWNICISICTIQRHLFYRLVRMCQKKGGGNDSVIKLHWSLMQNVVSWNKQVLFPLNTGMLTTKWLIW